MQVPKYQSLAESLGLVPGVEGKPLEPPEHLSAKDFCQAILYSRDFRQYLYNGILAGDLPAAIVIRLMDLGWGKPVERVEMNDVSIPLEDRSAEDLERRALLLAEMARTIRDSRDEKGSVH